MPFVSSNFINSLLTICLIIHTSSERKYSYIAVRYFVCLCPIKSLDLDSDLTSNESTDTAIITSYESTHTSIITSSQMNQPIQPSLMPLQLSCSLSPFRLKSSINYKHDSNFNLNLCVFPSNFNLDFDR